MLTHVQKRCWDETGIMQRNVTCMRGTGNVKSRLGLLLHHPSLLSCWTEILTAVGSKTHIKHSMWHLRRVKGGGGGAVVLR